MSFRIRLAAVLFALPVSVAAAEDRPAPGDCIGYSFDAAETASAYRVREGAERLNFVRSASEKAGCPTAGAECRARAYLQPGDFVLSSYAEGAFVCAMYRGLKGDYTSGWLPAAGLDKAPAAAAPSRADWAGRWERAEATIEIKPAKTGLAISGEATYGANVKQMVANGTVRSGVFSATVKDGAPMLAFADGDDGASSFSTAAADGTCLVRLWIASSAKGQRLVAEDNGQCGGMGVSFSGIYIRK